MSTGGKNHLSRAPDRRKIADTLHHAENYRETRMVMTYGSVDRDGTPTYGYSRDIVHPQVAEPAETQHRGAGSPGDARRPAATMRSSTAPLPPT
jgi:hypothetical protein